jgi:hypothetical protein
MANSTRLLLLWLLCAGIGWVAVSNGGRVGLFVCGVILVVWGVGVAANVRGLATALPRRLGVGPFSVEYTVGMLRRGFGFFALVGTVVVLSALFGTAPE